jgi:tetratricopeptide (TPR) repeat protein
VALAPASAPAQASLGAALEGQRRFTDAAESYRAALGADPDCVPALANLSTVCLHLGLVEEASQCAQHALRLAPRDAELHVRLGNVLMEQRAPAEAADSYREALRLQPGSAAIRNSLGFAHELQARFDEAMAFYDEAIAAEPGNVQAHVNRAALWLGEERFERGWEEYEWRLKSPDHAALYARFPQPLWDGSPLEGRRILVQAEQGLGDEILFLSCVPELLARAAHCFVDCEPRLAALCRRSFPQATVHGGRQSDGHAWLAGAGPIDLRIPAGSVPRYLRRTVADFPRHTGYLRAAPERVAAWRERLERLGPGRKVGLSWRGGVPQTGRGSRSIGLEELLPVLRIAGLAFVNLQYDGSEEELERLQAKHGVRVHHWREALDDYDETAALVSALDLTLSVCTAVVDLAGALGCPAWVMAPVRADFRYGRAGEAVRWYPSVRMFRQQRYGDWGPVIGAIAEALQRAPA